jgi:dTMP kinase
MIEKTILYMGKLINLEGCDGAGKSLQIKLITEHYQKLGKKVKFIHFPMYGHNMFSDMISKFLRGEYGGNDEVDPLFVANIYAMDRYMYKNQLLTDLEENDVVVMDRYVFSNVAYQVAKTMIPEERENLFQILYFEFELLRLPYPDITMFFDVEIKEIERRLNLGRSGEDREYLNGKQDIHEKDIEYQARVREVYLDLEKYPNFYVIKTYNEKGVMTPEDLFESYIDYLKY